MTAEMLTLALDISTVRRDESGRCDSGLCPFHLFRSVRQPFFCRMLWRPPGGGTFSVQVETCRS